MNPIHFGKRAQFRVKPTENPRYFRADGNPREYQISKKEDTDRAKEYILHAYGEDHVSRGIMLAPKRRKDKTAVGLPNHWPPIQPAYIPRPGTLMEQPGGTTYPMPDRHLLPIKRSARVSKHWINNRPGYINTRGLENGIHPSTTNNKAQTNQHMEKGERYRILSQGDPRDY